MNKKILSALLALLIAMLACTDNISPGAPGSPTSTNTVEAGSTEAVGDESSCGSPVDSPVSFDIKSNMDVGDPALVSVVYAWDKVNDSTAFVGVIEKTHNLDFENPQIQGQYVHFISMNDAICYAKEMAANLGVSTLLFVGDGNIPSGFTTALPVAGWKMHQTVYTEEKIETEGAVWSTYNVSIDDASHTYSNADWIYGQVWDGKDADVVYHFTVEPGYKLTTPKYQGTYWVVSGGDIKTVLLRFIQMTAEVVQRDDGPTVIQAYCGESDTAMTMPDGFVCKH